MLPPSMLRSGQTSPILLGLLAAAALYGISSWRAKCQADKKLEGATRVPFLAAMPLLGNTLEVAANTNRFQDWVAERSKERDGQPFAVRLLGKNDVIYTARPNHFEQVLKEQSDNFNKGIAMYEVYADFMGEGILLTNGDRWKYHRRVLVNLFSARALRDSMTPVIQRNVQLRMGILSRASESKEALNMYKLMNKFTFETFAEIGFGRKLGNLSSLEDHPFELALTKHIESVATDLPLQPGYGDLRDG
ncbi:unnamed protein product [Phytophthora lilii]|uniref:Unnamed protein product n=1 Tax=Phytophthora lilii TaxID=2077276 RepID=A0A9W6TFI8_9STRA|nr:unnamed protein product [Phytophthora lilii]